MTFGKTTPIFRIFDEVKAKEFYLEFLGFELDWEHRFEPGLPLYMQVSLGDCLLHLSEHHGDCSPGGAARIETAALGEYCARLSEKNYRGARPSVERMPWGTRDMTILDPFMNRLVFTDAIFSGKPA